MKKVIVAVLVAGILAIPSLASAKEVIKATDSNTWKPKKVFVGTDEKVIWKNPTSSKHTVTGKGSFSFNEKLKPGTKTSFKFSSTGTYKYHCTIHKDMDGRVIVE